MNKDELLPCPCCGSTDVGGARGIVHCYGCHLKVERDSTDDAVIAWNKRSSLDAELVEALEEAIKWLRQEGIYPNTVSLGERALAKHKGKD